MKYGALIRQESGRLKELVEQVLSFAGSQAGRMTQETQPLAVERSIEASVEASRTVIEGGHFVLEKNIAPELAADCGRRARPAACGAEPAHQCGQVRRKRRTQLDRGFGGRDHEGGAAMIEIRVADRGPGIPAEEQTQIFDPFLPRQTRDSGPGARHRAWGLPW